MPVITEWDKLQETVGQWGKRTFPNSTIDSIREHLADEELELDTAIEDYTSTIARDTDAMNDGIQEEVADCVLLLLHLAHRMNFSLDRAVREKFAEVQTRTWDSGTERGYSRHVEDGEGGA